MGVGVIYWLCSDCRDRVMKSDMDPLNLDNIVISLWQDIPHEISMKGLD